jgi:hypothetical protein
LDLASLYCSSSRARGPVPLSSSGITWREHANQGKQTCHRNLNIKPKLELCHYHARVPQGMMVIYSKYVTAVQSFPQWQALTAKVRTGEYIFLSPCSHGKAGTRPS